jgi:hypothetical protein
MAQVMVAGQSGRHIGSSQSCCLPIGKSADCTWLYRHFCKARLSAIFISSAEHLFIDAVGLPSGQTHLVGMWLVCFVDVFFSTVYPLFKALLSTLGATPEQQVSGATLLFFKLKQT